MPPFPTNLFPLCPRAYQCCHLQHLRKVPNTRVVEKAGRALMAMPAVNIAVVRNFTTDVCAWGGRTGNRILWRIRGTPDADVLAGITRAIALLGLPRILQALTAIQTISGLGRFSYSSKHLRMLAPNLCGVYDSIVEQFLLVRRPGATSANLFLDYCLFCQEKACELTAARVMLGDFIAPCSDPIARVELDPGNTQSNWTAADVDMACFAWLQKWCSECRCSAEPEAIPHVCPVVHIPAPEKLRAPSATSGHAETESIKGRNAISPIGDSEKSPAKTMIYLQPTPKRTFTKIVNACGDHHNLGLITRAGGLWLKADERPKKRYLIAEIIAAGGPNLPIHREFRTMPHGAAPVGGTGYQGGVALGSPANCRQFLERWFVVGDCP